MCYAETETEVRTSGLHYLVWMFGQAGISRFDLNKPYLAKNKREWKYKCILSILCDTIQEKAS